MKKILLGAFALFAALAVNAQVEIITLNSEDVGVIPKDDEAGIEEVDQELAGGTIIGGEDSSIPVTVKYTDTYKPVSISYGLNINDEDIEKAKGLQGSTNGGGSSATGSTDSSYPSEGCIYSVTPASDGYLYFIHKASYNKKYIVFEMRDRIPYYFSMYDATNDVYGEYNLFNGYTDVNAADDAGSNIGNVASYWNEEYSEWIINENYPIQWPEYYDTNLAAATSGGVSVIAFPVIGEYEYLCYATGSKMSLGYVLYSPDDDVTITTSPTSDESVTIYKSGTVAALASGSGEDNSGEGSGEEGSEGISNVTINLDSTGAIYNIAGQRLSTMGKGINVVNGQKILVK
ncbi:MAG: hypothetical protein LUC88_06445 [Prevotella sp.]|nr:hypothetical protein [Prevotella sp.]